MSLTFIDTNILVYAHDRDGGARYDTAVALLKKLWDEHTGVLSAQVLAEFYQVATRKLKPAMHRAKARDLVAIYGEWCSTDTTAELLVSASVLEEMHKLSWWDSLIIEAALRSGATTLLSEDLQHGRRFGMLTVRNPFVENN